MKTIQKFANALALGRLATAPSNSIDGTIYYDTTLNEFRIKKAGVWTSVSSGGDLSNYYTKAEIDSIITGLTTDDIAEAGNLYFTDARAKTAAVVDSLAGSQTDQAPSVSAVKTALDLKADESELANYLELAGGTMTGSLILAAAPVADLEAATKKYVDDAIIAATPEAIDVSYDNVASGLAAINVQQAIDELANEISTLPDPITYKGTYDASTNTPALSNLDTNVSGFLYRVVVAGNVDFGAGEIELAVGDSVVNNGTFWEKWDHSDQVLSVNGQTGAVVLSTNDIAEASNLYFTEERVRNTVLTGLTGSMVPIAETDTVLEAFGKAKAQIESKISSLVEDSAPQLSNDLKTGIYKINAENNPLVLQGNSIRRIQNPIDTEFIEQTYVPTVEVSASTTNNVLFTLDSEYDACEITYKVKTSSTSEVRIGKLSITKNSANAYITESFSESAELAVEFSAEYSLGQVSLMFDNGLAEAVQVKMDVLKFLA